MRKSSPLQNKAHSLWLMSFSPGGVSMSLNPLTHTCTPHIHHGTLCVIFPRNSLEFDSVHHWAAQWGYRNTLSPPSCLTWKEEQNLTWKLANTTADTISKQPNVMACELCKAQRPHRAGHLYPTREQAETLVEQRPCCLGDSCAKGSRQEGVALLGTGAEFLATVCSLQSQKLNLLESSWDFVFLKWNKKQVGLLQCWLEDLIT